MAILTGFSFKKMYGCFAGAGELRSQRTAERNERFDFRGQGWWLVENNYPAGMHTCTTKIMHLQRAENSMLNGETNYMYTQFSRACGQLTYPFTPQTSNIPTPLWYFHLFGGLHWFVPFQSTRESHMISDNTVIPFAQENYLAAHLIDSKCEPPSAWIYGNSLSPSSLNIKRISVLINTNT